MTLSDSIPSPRRGWMFYTGWALTLLPTLFILSMLVVITFFKPELGQESMGKYGFSPAAMRAILIIELICLTLYLVPPTAVLGAVLLSGYLGGAVATHLRFGEIPQAFSPIVFGVIFWLGLFFRDARVRALLPLRRTSATARVLSI